MIVPVATTGAFNGSPLNLTLIVSSLSILVSPLTLIFKFPVDCPASIVTVPLAAVKSSSVLAVPVVNVS